MEPKTGKRIVSRREYVKAQGKKAALYSNGILLLASVTVVLLSSLCLIWQRGELPLQTWLIGLLEGSVSLCLGYMGIRALYQSKDIDSGVPLTRANTADLPAPESLVRASSEPLQAQEAMLLRAAGEGQEKHEEQLVRAVEGVE